MSTLVGEEVLDALRAHGITAWARPSISYGEPTWSRHIYVVREPTRIPGQTARQYRQRRRAWARYVAWQKRIEARRRSRGIRLEVIRDDVSGDAPAAPDGQKSEKRPPSAG